MENKFRIGGVVIEWRGDPLPTDEQAAELIAILQMTAGGLEEELKRSGYQEITWVELV